MVTIRPMGERALLAETDGILDVLALHAALGVDAPDGVVQLVPAARTVLVEFDPTVLSPAAARAWIERAGSASADASPRTAQVVDVPVVYDGADLADTAALLGVSAEELVIRHAVAEWTVAFTGFAPGFGYLVSPEWTLRVPRLDTPRTRVPPGSVGLAAEFSGVYPRESPGGWRLVGRTDRMMFDPDAADPAVLAPGRRVRFRPVRELAVLAPAPRPRVEGHDVLIARPGPLATLQDGGRPGRAAEGVARSGALDRVALRTANRLLGNDSDAAAIEVTMGGFEAVAGRDLWVATTGAWAELSIDGHAVDPYVAHEWPAGTTLRLGSFAHGVRAYVAVRGGFTGPAVAGSVSTDLLAGLGAAPLAEGDGIGVGDATAGPVPVAALAPWGAPPDDEVVVELAPGPRADWFTAPALQALFDAVWTVSADADRVGVRLDGPELPRARADELPSEGMVPGALQVPPSGRPVVLQADGPVTGGYPVIAVVTDAALDVFAQVRPGTRIRFRHARV